MNKSIYNYEDVRDKIISGTNKIADPIRSTLSPKGSYVILENEVGNRFVTNDGVTIAKSITVDDPIEDTVIEIIRDASLKTNLEAGDGTSTTVLLSSILIKEGLKLIDEGYNRVDVARFIEEGASRVLDQVDAQVKPIKSEKDTRFVASVSSSNDPDITEDVCRVIKTSGEHGHVVLEAGFKEKTEIVEDNGFVLDKGLLHSSLKTQQDGKFIADDVLVLITDKKIYYKEEAQTILQTALNNGYTKVAVIAKDFIGEAPDVFIANHSSGNMQVALVKLETDDPEVYEDIAVYMKGHVVTEKTGKLVDKLGINDFTLAKKVLCYPNKTIITSSKPGSGVSKRVEALKQMLDDTDKETEEWVRLKRRISSLTTGLVTVRVGGRTSKELRERIYRYEDAINAVISAHQHGYLPGAGIALYNAYKKAELEDETERIFRKVCTANIKQVAENCDKYPEQIMEEIDSKGLGFGYNANTDKVENVLKAGVIDPYKATVLALANAVSVALIIIKSKHLILIEHEQEETDE